jgi:hypothetical protein
MQTAGELDWVSDLHESSFATSSHNKIRVLRVLHYVFLH